MCKKYNSQISCVGWKKVSDYNNAIIDSHSNDKVITMSACDAYKEMFYFRLTEPSCQGKLFKSDLVKENRFSEICNLGEDVMASYAFSKKANRVTISQTGKYYYYQRPDSLEHSTFNYSKLSINNFADYLLEDTRCTELYKSACCKVISSYFHVLFDMPKNQYVAERHELWKRICKIRTIVLFDNQARFKTRLAVLMSYMGEKSCCEIGKLLINAVKGKQDLYE